MWTMGVNNWIRYGWGKEMQDSWVPGSQLTVDFSGYDPSTNITNPVDAAMNTVREIVCTYPAPYTLMCSGGVDSQTMIWAWHKSKVPFSIVSVRYVSNGIFFNDYDLIQLNEFCAPLGLKIEYKDFDLLSFLENGLSEVANANDCDSPQICTYIEMTKKTTEGTICFSGNYLLGRMAPRALNYTLLGMHRYSMRSDTPTRKIIPFFLLHDPVLATSFDRFSPNKFSLGAGNIYHLAGFPVIMQADKFNGFEKAKEYYDKYKERVSAFDRLRYSNKPSKRTFDLLFRYPYEGVGEQYKNSVAMKQILHRERDDEFFNRLYR